MLHSSSRSVHAATLAPEKPATGQAVPSSSGGQGTRVMIIGELSADSMHAHRSSPALAEAAK